MQQQPHGSASADPASRVTPWQAWFSVFVLMIAAILGYVDRQVIALLVEPIRHSLQISDFQISLLQGVAFGLFYAVFGLPIGWLVDRYSRRAIIWAGISVWSLATAACGLASTYPQLLLARFGVGIGEAALAPAAYSLLADLFPPRRLAFAVSVYAMGSTIGTALAFTGGGLLIRHLEQQGPTSVPLLGTLEPWQMVFMLVGLPGVFIALLLWAMPEPRKHAAPIRIDPKAIGLWGFMGRNKRYFSCHFIGFGLIAMLAYGIGAWVPAMLMRRLGLDIAQVGMIVGLVSVLFGMAGFMFSGWFVDRWFARGRRDAHLRYFAWGCILLAILGPIAFLADNLWLFVPAFAVICFTQPFTGPAVAHLQMATPPELRGRVSAAFGLAFNLIGMCLGPPSVAFLTDFVFHDPMMVHKSLAIMYFTTSVLASLVFWYGLKAARRAVGETT